MAKRIGITMRVDFGEGQGEPRDCLAQDWANYMGSLCRNTVWMPLPNVGNAIVEYVQQWNLDGLIFSGGNDIGSVSVRDKTEFTLLDYAFRNELPIFGICRGLQLLQKHSGGTLARCQNNKHVARSHPVHLRADFLEFEVPQKITVNSYHSWAVPVCNLATSMDLIAASDDGYVEALRHRNAPIAAVQWHPEREASEHQAILDRNLIYQTLGLEN
jgi:N5-(cytidine 5'-diphosphoramidyl)-L-glutamine hydrolase